MAVRILIVEDDREISYMLRAAVTLLDSNFEVVDMPSAEEAMVEAQRGGFDLVIADVRLPGINGLEMMRRLRRSSIRMFTRLRRIRRRPISSSRRPAAVITRHATAARPGSCCTIVTSARCGFIRPTRRIKSSDPRTA